MTLARQTEQETIDLLQHEQNNSKWSPIALAIGVKTAKAVLRQWVMQQS